MLVLLIFFYRNGITLHLQLVFQENPHTLRSKYIRIRFYKPIHRWGG
jgi:hypothetical protein